MSELTEERGAVYGPPWEHHAKTAAILNVLGLHDQPWTAVQWQTAMIVDKIVRFSHTWEHLDSVADIKGYAECIEMTLENEIEEDFVARVLEYCVDVQPRPEHAPETSTNCECKGGCA